MRIFINTYVTISVFMYVLHKALAAYSARHGQTPALLRWHEVVHNIGHLLRIGLVLLALYLLLKPSRETSQGSVYSVLYSSPTIYPDPDDNKTVLHLSSVLLLR